MIVEMHSLTSHAPANLNRDDLGRPKSAHYGGVERARISSQAIKRSIRTSNYLEEKLGEKLSTRSRRIPKLVYDGVASEFEGNEKKLERLKSVCQALAGAIGKEDSKKELHTSQITFLTPGEIARAQKYARSIVESDSKLGKSDLSKISKEAAAEIGLNNNPGDGVDLALFGRMTTDNENAFASVDASMQVAHAISTHRVTTEVDWFTAVDDVLENVDDARGSSHLGEVEFNSAVYYKYFSCNLPLLIRNMNGAADEAIEALGLVLDAACRVTPSGKQNSFASHALADTVLLVHRPERIPVSLANAFEQPVKSGEDGYLKVSRKRLIDHYANLCSAYGLKDHAAFFCLDPAERADLTETLPDGTTVLGTLDEVFSWMNDHLKNEMGGEASA